jgi:tRNA/rRNA methyltransferase
MLLVGVITDHFTCPTYFYDLLPMQTRFILINTSHAGNVGAAARALKTMGFDDMVLVAPRWANVLRREETIQRASGANDVLDKCRIVETLDEALDGMTHLCATAMTARDFGPPTRAPREHLEAFAARNVAANRTDDSAGETIDSIDTGIAFLFGSERYGMKNEDVYRCHVALQIPTNPKFGSLNLASAIQLIAYEWQLIQAKTWPEYPVTDAANPHVESKKMADAKQIAGLLKHWEEMMLEIGYLDPNLPMKLMQRMQQIFNRAQLRDEEINILRGIARAAQRTIAPSKAT